MRGYYGIGVYHPKWELNVGTLWRHAFAFGASFIFTIGRRYKEQASDTAKSWHSIPLFHFANIGDLIDHLPHGCPLIGIELAGNSQKLPTLSHPTRAAYLLGAEDHGLPANVLQQMHRVVSIPGADWCLNVAVAGSIVLYDRALKAERRGAV